MNSIKFRVLTQSDLVVAYNIVIQSVTRLIRKQLPAWLVPYALYENRHVCRENYGLFLNQQLVVVVTLSASYHPPDWTEYLPETDSIWLSSLCVADRYQGQGLGLYTLMQAEAFLRDQRQQAVWLDCYYRNGFLPNYYQAHGYTWVARKEFIFKDGSLHDSVLMFKTL